MLRSFIELDNKKYAVSLNTYVRTWHREFSSNLSGGIVRLTFVDRGPGIQVWKMLLELRSWPTDSVPFQQGVTDSFETQRANLEASYAKITTALQFKDIFGEE